MTQRTLFPILLVGLPTGLAVSVIAALYLYYNPLDFPLPSRPRRPDSAALLRRSPNETDLRDYRRILSTELALRPPVDPARQRAVANWIASTLGPSNIGLPARVLSDTGEAAATVDPAALPPTVLIEIPGTRQKNDAIVVATGAHPEAAGLENAVSTSALMTVAGAFAGTPQRRTLVFAFLPGESADPQDRSPIDAVVQSLMLRSMTVRGIIDLRVGTEPATPRARVVAVSPRDGLAWTGEVREAFATRKPEGLSMDFISPAEAPAAAASLAGWRSAPAPYVLLHLSPSAPNDETSPLALARSLEGVLQALANQ